MDRRRLLQIVVASIPSLPSIWSWLLGPRRSAAAICSLSRVRPADPERPSEASWDRLSQEIRGPLMISIASPFLKLRLYIESQTKRLPSAAFPFYSISAFQDRCTTCNSTPSESNAFHSRRSQAVCGTYASRQLDERLGLLSAVFLSAWRSKG